MIEWKKVEDELPKNGENVRIKFHSLKTKKIKYKECYFFDKHGLFEDNVFTKGFCFGEKKDWKGLYGKVPIQKEYLSKLTHWAYIN